MVVRGNSFSLTVPTKLIAHPTERQAGPSIPDRAATPERSDVSPSFQAPRRPGTHPDLRTLAQCLNHKVLDIWS
jgi:hypothetical protein